MLETVALVLLCMMFASATITQVVALFVREENDARVVVIDWETDQPILTNERQVGIDEALQVRTQVANALQTGRPLILTGGWRVEAIIRRPRTSSDLFAPPDGALRL